MQIVLKGYAGVFEPRARCREATTGSVREEIARKRRIVNRSVAGLLRVRALLNPFRFGVFSVQIWLHKVVRWFSPLIAMTVLILLGFASIEHEVLRLPVLLVVVGVCRAARTPALGNLRPPRAVPDGGDLRRRRLRGVTAGTVRRRTRTRCRHLADPARGGVAAGRAAIRRNRVVAGSRFRSRSRRSSLPSSWRTSACAWRAWRSA